MPMPVLNAAEGVEKTCERKHVPKAENYWVLWWISMLDRGYVIYNFI